MRIEGVTFVGTRTEARLEMTEFVRDVLGLAPAPAGGMDAEVFAMPDGSSFAVTSPDTPRDQERTVGFRVADVDQAMRELREAGVSTDDEVSSSGTQRYAHFRPRHDDAALVAEAFAVNASVERSAARSTP